MSTPSGAYDVSTLRSSFVPDAAQSTEIQLTIALHEKLRDDFDAKLLELQKQTEELQSRREVACETLSLHQALVAPARRLMPEALGEIFEHCIDGPSFSACSAPLLLTHVCHKWRQVAYGTPQLWTQLSIHCDSSEHIDATLPIAMWIENSGSLPLDITINPKGCALGWQEAQNIVKHLSRCARFTLLGSYTELNQVLPYDQPLNLPLLQLFSMSCTSGRHNSVTDTVELVPTWDFQNLRTLILSNAGFILPMLVPTNSLRSLKILSTISRDRETIPHATWINFLRACIDIEVIEVHLQSIAPFQETTSTSSESLQCPKLRRLKICLGTRCGIDEMFFLINLHAPSLVYLSMSGGKWLQGDATYQALFALVAGSRATLRRLSLMKLDFPSEQCLALLHILTEIETIKFSADAFLAALLPPTGCSPSLWTCPKLTTLKVTDACASKADFVALIDRRAPPLTRNPGGQPNADAHYLKHVEVKHANPSGWSPFIRRSVRELRHSRENFTFGGLARLYDEEDEEED